MNQKRCETGGIRSIASWLDPTPTVPHVNVLAVDKNCSKVFYHNKKEGSWSKYKKNTVDELKCYPHWNFNRFLRMVSPAQTSLNFFSWSVYFIYIPWVKWKQVLGALTLFLQLSLPWLRSKSAKAIFFHQMKSVKTGAYGGLLVKILLLTKWLALIALRGTKFFLKVDFADG